MILLNITVAILVLEFSYQGRPKHNLYVVMKLLLALTDFLDHKDVIIFL